PKSRTTQNNRKACSVLSVDRAAGRWGNGPTSKKGGLLSTWIAKATGAKSLSYSISYVMIA
ncbi:MAG: hypothetical protein JXB07_15315, partial [Anaerolineae bacterium]|nr:hypothetical protein [Anaerolineae bacterium]